MRRWLKGLGVGLFTAAVGVLLGLTSLGASFEQNVGLAWLFNFRGAVPAPKGVVVVAIDDQTGGHLGLSKLPREWPRSVHGRLVDNLARLGASAIIFDFDFQQPKKPEDDAAFAKALSASKRVVLTEKLVGKRQLLINAAGKQTGSVWTEQLALPVPVLAQAAKGIGPFPLPKVQVAVHQFWVFKRSVGDAPTMPAIALQLYAMGAYPYLERLLNLAGISAPKAPAATARANEMRKFMLTLRSIFTSHPELDKSLREILANESQLDILRPQIPLVRALVGLYSGGSQRYLNFYGPPGSIATVPYYVAVGDSKDDVGTRLPDLKGKVVFIGFSDLYDPGQPDRFFTVFTNDDGVDLSGVEIAATAFGNLLTDKAIRTYGILGEISILATFGAVVGLIAYLLSAIAGVPLILILAAGYTAGAQQAFSEADVWIPLAIPLLVQLPLALFGGLMVQYLLERRKKTRATQAMSLYLPEHLARQITEKNMDASAVNRVTYSVCFASDMAGFTSIAEKMRPKELAAFLNDYFETLSAPLRRHGVDVIEFRADGIMCAWTGDQSDVGIRRKALLAGLEAVDAIARFKQRHHLLTQNLRIGLEAGMVYVGHAGGGGHFVYSIVGDCANTAARIEGLNKHMNTQLLASQSALDGVDGLLCRLLGEFRFVGKNETLPVLEVVALEETASDIQKKLCRDFTTAMEELQRGRWCEAGDLFEVILRDYPEDGPSQFHMARCRRYADSPPDESPWVVSMDAK